MRGDLIAGFHPGVLVQGLIELAGRIIDNYLMLNRYWKGTKAIGLYLC